MYMCVCVCVCIQKNEAGGRTHVLFFAQLPLHLTPQYIYTNKNITPFHRHKKNFLLKQILLVKEKYFLLSQQFSRGDKY